ncbi:MAG: hypothetical protein OEW08_13805, partial [Gammaproteobacteria bacterium]|nr:hypothetical protein [Gammaproteobacteria bacterium]
LDKSATDPTNNSPTTEVSGTVNSGTDDHHGDTTTTASANIQLEGAIPVLASNLGEVKKFTLSVKATGDFAGAVQLVASKGDLDQNHQAGSDIQITFDPAQITLAQGESRNFEVTLNVTPRAPDFKSTKDGGDGHFLVNAQADFGGNSIVATMDVPLQVNPVYDVHLIGEGSPGAGTKAPHKYDRPSAGQLAQTEIRSHVGGVTLRFYNDDKVKHVVHGDGTVVKHENTAAGAAGRVYETLVTSTAKQSGNYYCHNHESNANRRVILFNADR